jgi:NAD(P)-dependent dehydrogenase (short-subunit alcohol dehydrogenase family)
MAESVLIIGASRGIGLGLAKAFAERGWQVTATVRDRSKPGGLDKISGVTIETVDIAEAASARALAERLADVTFDVVIVNAGMGGPRGERPETVNDADFCQLFLTNALGPVRIAEFLIGCVRPQTGVIGLMTSQLGSVEQASAGGVELYRASKAALNSFTRSFAARHRELGLAILSLHPGWVKTDMGGPNAPVTVEDSAAGLLAVIERARKDRQDGYFDYRGETLPW